LSFELLGLLRQSKAQDEHFSVPDVIALARRVGVEAGQQLAEGEALPRGPHLAFLKKSQKTPRRALELARPRLKEVLR
jgi:hypothetical protein